MRRSSREIISNDAYQFLRGKSRRKRRDRSQYIPSKLSGHTLPWGRSVCVNRTKQMHGLGGRLAAWHQPANRALLAKKISFEIYVLYSQLPKSLAPRYKSHAIMYSGAYFFLFSIQAAASFPLIVIKLGASNKNWTRDVTMHISSLFIWCHCCIGSE